jgi:hypothetical protein
MNVHGRLLGPDRVPVRHGSVSIRTLLDDEPSRGAVPRQVATDPEGRFQCTCDRGERLEIIAWGASTPPLWLIRSVSPSEAVHLGDLELERGTSLHGRALVGGKPSSLGQIELLVRRLDTMASGAFHTAKRRALTAHPDDPGTAYVRCLAGDLGTWVAEGLSPGRYEVSVLSVGSMPLHDALRSQSMRIAEPPTEEILLDLAACHLDLTAAPHPAPHPLEPILLRWDVTDQEGRITSRECVGRGGWMAPDASEHGWSLLVPASSEVDVWAVAHLCAPWRTTVRTTEAGSKQALVADFTRAQLGRLEVDAPDGAPREDLGLRLLLFEMHTRHLVLEKRVHDAPFQVDVPMGTWDAELHTEGFRASRPSRFCLPQRARITVEAERTTRLQWLPPLGAMLRIQTAQAGTGFVRCTLIRHTGTQEATEFLPVSALDASYPAGVYPVPGPLVAGDLHELTHALDPGTVTVRLECKGCSTFEERLVLEAGVVHDLLARLEPR